MVVPADQIARLIHTGVERDQALHAVVMRCRDLMDAAQTLTSDKSDANDIEDAGRLFDALSRLVPVEIDRCRAVLATSPTIKPRTKAPKR